MKVIHMMSLLDAKNLLFRKSVQESLNSALSPTMIQPSLLYC